MSESYANFDAVKERLDEIVEAVSRDELPLDDALGLYEEAVGLGLRASDMLEKDIEIQDACEQDSSNEEPPQRTGSDVFEPGENSHEVLADSGHHRAQADPAPEAEHPSVFAEEKTSPASEWPSEQ